MQIPYEVQNRPDTGLYNAKVGIWLFLASEVMLFGGLFSSYVFLRIGADFPWPFHELVVWPGFLNTMVLIASSVSVVAAWAALKQSIPTLATDRSQRQASPVAAAPQLVAVADAPAAVPMEMP